MSAIKFLVPVGLLGVAVLLGVSRDKLAKNPNSDEQSIRLNHSLSIISSIASMISLQMAITHDNDKEY